MDPEDNKFSRNLKGIDKGLDIYEFRTVENSIGSEVGRIIALQDQAYYVPGLQKDLFINQSQGI